MEYAKKFESMAAIGAKASFCLDLLAPHIKPGVTTGEIDLFVKNYADDNGLICAPLDYKGFPSHCCTSVNHVVCHGIPSATKILKEGDIIKVDVTFKDKDGWHGDTCRTFPVGKISIKAQRLILISKIAMEAGIAVAKPGNRIGVIGLECQKVIEAAGMSVVRGYCGHGIGQEFHTLPPIFHYYDAENPHVDQIIEPGMIFTVEPMVNVGKPNTKVLSDGWTVVTRDRSLSAQFEHTIGITENGNQIFTS